MGERAINLEPATAQDIAATRRIKNCEHYHPRIV
jgi:hypothetical protein